MANRTSTDTNSRNASMAILVMALFVTNLLVNPASAVVHYPTDGFGPAFVVTLLQVLLLATGIVITKVISNVIGVVPFLALCVALWMRLVLDLILRPSSLSIDAQNIRGELWAALFFGNLLFGASFMVGRFGAVFGAGLTFAMASYLMLFGASPYQALAAITGPLVLTIYLFVVRTWWTSAAAPFEQKVSRPLGHPAVMGLVALLAMMLGTKVWMRPNRDVALAAYVGQRGVAPMRTSDVLRPIHSADGCEFESMTDLTTGTSTDVCLPVTCDEAMCFRGRDHDAEMLGFRREAGEFVRQNRVPIELPDRSLRFDPDPGQPPRWTEGGLRVPVYSIGQRTIWGRFPLAGDARYWVNVPLDRNLSLLPMSYGAIRRAVFPVLCLLGLILAAPLALALRRLPKPIASKPGLTVQYRKRVPIWLRGLLFTESDPKRLYLYGEFTEADYRHGDQVKNALTSHLEPPQLRRQGIVRAVGCVAVFAMFAMMFSGL